jgi:hypothetical protein
MLVTTNLLDLKSDYRSCKRAALLVLLGEAENTVDMKAILPEHNLREPLTKQSVKFVRPFRLPRTERICKSLLLMQTCSSPRRTTLSPPINRM